MAGVEDASTPGTQQDEKKPLDGAGGQHINLKVKGQVRAVLLFIASGEVFLVDEVIFGEVFGGVSGVLCD